MRVGPLLVVVEVALAAECRDARRVSFDAESPASDVDVVNTVVANVAATEVMPPAPNAMQEVGLIRHEGRRTNPSVVIEMLRRIGRLLLSDRPATLTVPRLCDEDFADRTGLELVHRLDDVRRAAALSSHLHDDFVSPSRLDHQSAFSHVVRARFLDIDMLACGRRQNCCGSVPVIRSRDPDRFDLFVIEHLPHVFDDFGSQSRSLRHRVRRTSRSLFIDIADVGNSH